MRARFIKEFVPCSWFHPKGVYKVVERLKDRLPDVNGSLFATFTLDRTYFQNNEIGPSEAFDLSRSHIRKVFYKLRKGVNWEDKLYKIKSPYCTKVEFHDDEEGWPHFHIIWLTKRFIPAELIGSLWGYGRTNVKRITNTEFNYLLKYVCKSGKVPEWVGKKKLIRIFQSSKGFLKPIEKPKKEKNPNLIKRPKRTYQTIEERLNKYRKTALLIDERFSDKPIMFRQIELNNEFQILLDRLVYPIAQDGRYLGDGKIQILNRKDIYPWINIPKL